MMNQDHKKFQVKTIFLETSGRPKGRSLMTSWYYNRRWGRSKIEERSKTHDSKKMKKWEKEGSKRGVKKAGKTGDVIYERP